MVSFQTCCTAIILWYCSPSSGKFSSLFWSMSTFLNNMFSSILFYFLIVRQLSSQGILKKRSWRNSFHILKYEKVILCVCVKLFLIFILCWIISLLAVLLVSSDSKVIQLYIYIYPFFLKLYSHLCYYRILSTVSCAIQ